MPAISAFLFCFIPVVLGLGAALGVHLKVLMPRFGTGNVDLNRMIEVGHRLDTPLSDKPSLVFIGDSVTVEGIDSTIVAKNSPAGWRVFNFGINGCDRAELDVIVPKVVKSQPKAICIVLRPLSIAMPPDVEVDGAYAYNIGGFPQAWPSNWIASDTPGVPPEIVARLQSSNLKAQAHFRTSFQQMINNKLRAKFRAGIKASRSDDFDAPFNMTASISGDTLDKHINTLAKEIREGIKGGTELHERDLARLIALVGDAKITPVFISAPIHPRLRDEFVPTAKRLTALATEWAAKYHGIYADASLLLDDSGFADGQHLNEKGRAALSAFVGSKLPSP